jgi:tetratricopeptide (TPR) repeat protein
MRLKAIQITTLLVAGIFVLGCQAGLSSPDQSPQTDPSVINTVVDVPRSSTGAAYYYFSIAQMKLKEGALNEAQWFLEKAIQNDAQSAVLKLELSDLYLARGDSGKALATIRQVLIDNPDNTEALVLAGRIHQQQDEIPEAKALFEKALANNPSDPDIYLYLGRIYWNDNDLANAERVFRRMAANFPSSYAAHYFNGKVLAAQGKYAQAINAFTRSLELEPSLEEPRFELIKIYQTQKKNDLVIQTYKTLLELNPDNVKASLELADYYRQTKRSALGLPLLFDLGRRIESDDSVLNYLFENYLETKQYETAVWAIEGMLQATPQSAELHYLAGVAYDGMKKVPLALDHFAKVTYPSRFYENAVAHRAILLRDMGKIDQSIAVIRQALVNDPHNANYFLYLGSFYEELERYDEALVVLKQGLAVDAKNPRIHFRIGVIQDKAGRRNEAIEAMQQVLRIRPDDVDALNYLGYTYADMGIHLDEAQSLVQRALTLKPGDGYITDSLAWVFYKQGRYEEALKWILKAVQIVPDDAVILEHMGDVYLKLGNKDKALKYFHRSLELKDKDRPLLEDKIRALNPAP